MSPPAAQIVEQAAGALVTGQPLDLSPATMLAVAAGAAAGESDSSGKKWGVGAFTGVDWNQAEGLHKEVGLQLVRHVGNMDLYGAVSRDDGGTYAARAGLQYNF